MSRSGAGDEPPSPRSPWATLSTLAQGGNTTAGGTWFHDQDQRSCCRSSPPNSSPPPGPARPCSDSGKKSGAQRDLWPTVVGGASRGGDTDGGHPRSVNVGGALRMHPPSRSERRTFFGLLVRPPLAEHSKRDPVRYARRLTASGFRERWNTNISSSACGATSCSIVTGCCPSVPANASSRAERALRINWSLTCRTNSEPS